MSRPGRVLLYAAEDAHHIVRARLEGICAAAGIEITALDAHVITAPTLRLDQHDDQRRLDDAVARRSPRLLVLDPFVRLHRIDENASAEVAPLLAQQSVVTRLRSCSCTTRAGEPRTRDPVRRFAVAPNSTHGPTAHSTCVASMNGSRSPSNIVPQASASGITIELRDHPPAPALHVVDAEPSPRERPEPDPADRVLDALASADAALSVAQIAERCPMRTQRLYAILGDLMRAGRVARDEGGYRLARSR